MAATAAWRRTTVTRYGVTEAVDLAVITCLWWGSLHRTPVRVVLVRDLGLANLTILILWYDQAGQPDADLNSRRQAAPWYRRKHHVSVETAKLQGVSKGR